MRTFMPYADQNVCKIHRDDFEDEITFSSAEVDKVTHLIGIALGMENMEVLPDHIAHSPFVIRFLEEGFLRLEREDASGSIRFNWEEGDELITTFHDARAMAVNEVTLVKSPRGVNKPNWSDSPFI